MFPGNPNPDTNQPPDTIKEPGKGVEDRPDSERKDRDVPLEVPGDNQTPQNIPPKGA